MWVDIISLAEGLNRRKRWKEENLLSCMSCNIHFLLSCYIGPPGSKVLGFKLRLIQLASLVLRPSDLNWNYTTCVLRLPAWRQQIGSFLVSIITWANSSTYLPTYPSIYLSILQVLFLWRTLKHYRIKTKMSTDFSS